VTELACTFAVLPKAELLYPSPKVKLKNHLISFIRYCLFSIFWATNSTQGTFSRNTLRTLHGMVSRQPQFKVPEYIEKLCSGTPSCNINRAAIYRMCHYTPTVIMWSRCDIPGALRV